MKTRPVRELEPEIRMQGTLRLWTVWIITAMICGGLIVAAYFH
jgi:hypothetical protein